MANSALKRPNIPELYEHDFFAWTQEQARLLRERRFDQIDFKNVIEELESLGRREKREIASRLHVLLVHLLKWKFQPAHRSSGWKGSINEQRNRLAGLLHENPSLHGAPEESLEVEYAAARSTASAETGLLASSFPGECPFTVEQILSPDFFPDGLAP